MKKSLVVMIMVGLIAGAFAAAPADAKKKKKAKPRTVSVEYAAPGIGATVLGAGGGFCPFADPTNFECIEVAPAAGEKFVKVEITDATGGAVAGFISQGDIDGDGVGDGYGEYCRGHANPIPLQAAAPVRVSFYPGTCEDGTPSTPTTGTIKITFYKKI